MFWHKPAICLVLATVTILKLSGADAAARGRGGPGTWTRHGSLSLRQQGREQGAGAVLNEKLQRMDPSVQCSDTAMTLKVKGVRTPHFLVESGEGPLIPVSQLPSHCGFSVKRSRRDVTFRAPYQGCHVSQQDGSYVLPLHFSGSPMTVSCPAASPLPSVTCFRSGMVLKISGVTASQVHIKVSGTWTPLSSACSSCGMATEVDSGGVRLTAPYRGLCVSSEGDQHSLYLLVGGVELLVTCPSSITGPPSRGGGHGGRFLPGPVFPPSPVMPGATVPPPLPTRVVVSPQKPTNAEGNPFSRFPYLPPQYLGQYSAEDLSALLAQFYTMQQQYPYQLPVSAPYSMVPGPFQPTAPPFLPPASTRVPTDDHDGVPPPHPGLQQFLGFPPQYPFLPFRGAPPADQSLMLKPSKDQVFQISMLPNYGIQQDTGSSGPGPTQTAPPTTKPAPQSPPSNPYQHLPQYAPQPGQQQQQHPPGQWQRQHPPSYLVPHFDPFGYQQTPN